MILLLPGAEFGHPFGILHFVALVCFGWNIVGIYVVHVFLRMPLLNSSTFRMLESVGELSMFLFDFCS